MQWMFMPAAAAFLWCSPSAPSRRHLHHPIVSHCYSATPSNNISVDCIDSNSTSSSSSEDFFALPTECSMLGTRDYSPMLVVPAALGFAEVSLLPWRVLCAVYYIHNFLWCSCQQQYNIHYLMCNFLRCTVFVAVAWRSCRYSCPKHSTVQSGDLATVSGMGIVHIPT